MGWSVSPELANRLNAEETDGFIGKDAVTWAQEAINNGLVDMVCELETGKPGKPFAGLVRPNWYFGFQNVDGPKISDWLWNSEYGYRANFAASAGQGMTFNRSFILSIANALISFWQSDGNPSLTSEYLNRSLMTDQAGGPPAKYEPKFWTKVSPYYNWQPDVTTTTWLEYATMIVDAWNADMPTQFPTGKPPDGFHDDLVQFMEDHKLPAATIKSIQGVHAPTGEALNDADFIVRGAWLNPAQGYALVPNTVKTPLHRAHGLHNCGWT